MDLKGKRFVVTKPVTVNGKPFADGAVLPEDFPAKNLVPMIRFNQVRELSAEELAAATAPPGPAAPPAPTAKKK